MKFDLQERLIRFAVVILDVVELMPKTTGSNQLANQLARSGTAPALLYGEAQSAESRRDFIHKMKLGLKELRETFICLSIIDRKRYLTNHEKLRSSLSESNELIAIFSKSITTAKKNLPKDRLCP